MQGVDATEQVKAVVRNRSLAGIFARLRKNHLIRLILPLAVGRLPRYNRGRMDSRRISGWLDVRSSGFPVKFGEIPVKFHRLGSVAAGLSLVFRALNGSKSKTQDAIFSVFEGVKHSLEREFP